MRLVPSFHLSYPDVGALRIALTAGAVAGLVVLAACTDTGKSITAPTSIRKASIGSGGFGQAKTLTLCVDKSSPTGTYTFTNTQLNRSLLQGGAFPGDGFGVALPGNGWFVNPGYFDPGDGGDGTTVANANENVPYSLTITNGVDPTIGNGGCVLVLNRTVGNADFMASRPVSDGGPCDPALTSCGGINDSFAAATIQFQSGPGVYDHTDCLLDDGVLIPQQANPPVSFTAWPIGGLSYPGSPPVNYPCDNHGNPIRGFVNFEHGATITFAFTPPTTTPCPAGSFTASLNGSGDLVMVFDQFPAPNDNSYGANAVGWPNGHTFSNLTGSDKAGFQIKNSSGTTVLDVNIDYLSAKTGTPSGYASLGPFGGDGDVNVGTLVAGTDITWTTSLAENLNSTGFCVALNCSGGGTNLLVDSPPVTDANYTLPGGSPYGAWNFHDTYFVTVKASKLAALGLTGDPNLPGGWSAGPNLTALHNSPAKPCPAGPFPCSDITVGNKTFGSKEVKVDVNNVNTTTDAFVTGVSITWPTGTNGALKQIKIGGDVIWSGTNNTGNATFVLADLVADANKRKIGKHSDEDVKFVFANNASTTLASYAATLNFGDDCVKTILP